MQAQRRGTGFQERIAGSGLKALVRGLITHVAIFQHFAGALLMLLFVLTITGAGALQNLNVINIIDSIIAVILVAPFVLLAL